MLAIRLRSLEQCTATPASPLTNSMPMLRHGLHVSAGPRDFLMA
jgi:hypothetical protein